MAKLRTDTQSDGGSVLTIYQSEKCMVDLKTDGTVVFGDGYKPDAAAKVVWEAIAERYSRVWGRVWLITKTLSELPEKNPIAQFPDCMTELIMEAKRVIRDAPMKQ